MEPAEAADPSKLFTIHLHQIQGVGIVGGGPDDWMHKTRGFREMVLIAFEQTIPLHLTQYLKEHA